MREEIENQDHKEAVQVALLTTIGTILYETGIKPMIRAVIKDVTTPLLEAMVKQNAAVKLITPSLGKAAVVGACAYGLFRIGKTVYRQHYELNENDKDNQNQP